MDTVNGLVGPYDYDKAIWRQTCSDFMWQDPACLAIAPSKCQEFSKLGFLENNEGQNY